MVIREQMYIGGANGEDRMNHWTAGRYNRQLGLGSIGLVNR